MAHRRKQPPDVRLLFHYLQSDGFWSALDGGGEPSPDNRLTRYAAVNPDFVAFANDPISRNKARHLLIAKYFRPAERIALYTLVGLPIPKEEEIAADAATLIYEKRTAVNRILVLS